MIGGRKYRAHRKYKRFKRAGGDCMGGVHEGGGVPKRLRGGDAFGAGGGGRGAVSMRASRRRPRGSWKGRVQRVSESDAPPKQAAPGRLEIAI